MDLIYSVVILRHFFVCVCVVDADVDIDVAHAVDLVDGIALVVVFDAVLLDFVEYLYYFHWQML